MGKQNKNPGKRWQELLGLSSIPYFGQDTIPYKDDQGETIEFDPDTMSLIGPLDVESGLYNKNAFDNGMYTPIYDQDRVFLGYAYNNDDFAYLDNFLKEENYYCVSGNVNINQEEQRVTARAVSRFISKEFTDSTKYTLFFTYEVNTNAWRNVILYGHDQNTRNGYNIGIDIPATGGFGIETIVDGEATHKDKYSNKGFASGVYEVKIVRDGSDATIYVDDEQIGVMENIQYNTLGLWKWQEGSSNISNIFLKEESTPENPSTQNDTEETVNISVTVTDGENPINSASVTLTDSITSDTITGTTGSAGGCTLSNVPLGDYSVTVSATNYENYSDTISVAKETTTLSITMNPSSLDNED